MLKIKIIFLCIFLGMVVREACAQNENIFLVKAFDCRSGPGERAQTGFRIRGSKGVLTALHGVVGCEKIKVQSETGVILYDAVSIKLADIKHDAAVLSSIELENTNTDGLDIDLSQNWTSNQSLTVTGHPFGISAISTQIQLRNPPATSLSNLIPPGHILNSLTQRLSPEPGITVLSIQGIILPGHSGAPVLNSKNAVIAVANGGLGGGTTQITWAIPMRNIQWADVTNNAQVRSRISILATGLSTNLFSFDENVPPLYPIAKSEKKAFSKGEMETDIVVTPNGSLEATTHIRGTDTLDGFCGNVTFWFFDRPGNRLGIYGMGKDHQWCVGSGIESLFGGGRRTRLDKQSLIIPKDVINKTNSISIIHLEGPGKNTSDLIRDALSGAISSKKILDK